MCVCIISNCLLFALKIVYLAEKQQIDLMFVVERRPYQTFSVAYARPASLHPNDGEGAFSAVDDIFTNDTEAAISGYTNDT